MKRYFYKVPPHVAASEAAELYRYMALGATDKTEYLDKRNQCIFNSLENLMQQIGRVGTRELIQYLNEQELLNAVGGVGYVTKVFNGLEPMEAV